MPPLYTALLLVHLLAGAFWVGGMAVMLAVVRPAAVALLGPPARLAFLDAALGRFLRLAGVAVVAALVSGLAMVEIAGGFAVVRGAVHTMAALALAMALIYGHVQFALYPRLHRAVAVQDWPGAGGQLARVRTLVSVNLLLGAMVFAVAVFGRLA